ncbi:helix-turn-helix domain-containing protein [Flavobacterium humi]|uniref:AraC family transcriptional regulator n=1 Tax=Flavobacterium humi TaxID=2562683 RepID=A0A4Z0LBX1_9FLAO|nr:helix-turn-helix domain-containing protein [Flavobacterium humi]TGD59376.1 AraC family transcriptional regulator [Flavobacterium humi]
MNTILLTFCYFSCLMSLLCVLIIVLQNKFHLYYKILVLLCLISCIMVIGSWTFFQGKVPLLEHAYLWVTSFPIDFLPGALLYLYVKSVLQRAKRISKWDLLHFAPALLHCIELIPFYLLPVQEKQHFLTLYLLYPNYLPGQGVFMLPMDAHVLLKTGLWCLYIVLTIVTLLRFHKKNPLWIIRNNHIWYWITRLTGIHVISLLISLSGLFLFSNYAYLKFSVIHPVFFILTCIILLMFKPKILYGLSHFSNTDTLKREKEEEMLSKNFELSPVKVKEYKEKIESFIQNEKIFLIKNYSLGDLSNDLGIPLHHLSYVINKEFCINYKSFINNCRVAYIIQHRYDPEWSQFSLEGIGNEAGFNSRNTFFKAFKIATGETPSEYFRKKEEGNRPPKTD